MSIAENIKDARMKNGLSQQQLADQIGCTRQLISKWETGSSMPDAQQVIILSEKLKISYQELLNGISDEKKSTGDMQISVKSENFQLLIVLCLMILSSVTSPFGAVAAIANVLYCFRHKLGIFLLVTSLLMLVYTIYQAVIHFFPGIA